MKTSEAVTIVDEFVNSGPSRSGQMESDVRDIYREYGFDLQNDTPSRVLSELLHLSWNEDTNGSLKHHRDIRNAE